MDCPDLNDVNLHDGILNLGGRCFARNKNLRWITMPGVREVKNNAFDGCRNLDYVEFGNQLDIIRQLAFTRCYSLQCLTMSSVRAIEWRAFHECQSLVDIVFGVELERIENEAFYKCIRLTQITIPLKNDMIEGDPFSSCPSLGTVYLVGGIHKTVSYLHFEGWRNSMKEEFDRINKILPYTHSREKTATIQQWIQSVIDRFEYYRVAHNQLLKEVATSLELAVWKAKLDLDVDEDTLEPLGQGKEGSKGARKKRRITSGASISIVIKNVLPFLRVPI